MYDIFISYTNQDPDRQIAEKLYNTLNSPYFTVFFDKERLGAGTPWNEQLQETLKTSNHLVVIWSSKANQSQWVQAEIANFRANKKPNSLVIPVCLDIDPNIFQEQAIMDFKNTGFYPDQTNVLDENLYNKVVNRIRTAIYIEAGSKPIKRVVFTLTNEKAQQLSNINSITDSYGEHYADWKPYGSDQDIVNILDKFLYVDINQKAKEITTLYHWDDLDWKEKDSRLYSDSLDVFDAEIKDLSDHHCVLILDPFALNDQLIKERFVWCYDKCYMNARALIMSLTYSLASHFTPLRSQLRKDANLFYNNYFNPPYINNSILANGFAYMIDSLEVKRQLQIALRSQRGDQPTNAFTHHSY